jgi:lysylphosphatidylglycerol synthetase-like protein (DUF2156 family)
MPDIEDDQRDSGSECTEEAAESEAAEAQLVALATRRRMVLDEISVPVPRGSRILVFADLRLSSRPDDTAREASRTVARPIEECRGPAIVVLSGDTFDLLDETRVDLDSILAAHPRLTTALQAFLSEPERKLIVLPGLRDAALAHDPRSAEPLSSLGAELAFACVLEIDTGCGLRIVRVEPGHQLDPAAAFVDPRDPNDHPLAQHVEREVLPAYARAGGMGDGQWLEGVEDADPGELGAVVASRFAYRRLFRRAVWLIIPALVALALYLPIELLLSEHLEPQHPLGRVLRLLAGGVALELIVVGLALVFVVAQLRDALGSVSWWAPEARENDNARGMAVGLVAAGGAGLVTGHTRRAELTDLGAGAFYANCGTAGRVLERVPGRAGMPAVFAARLRCSWVELEAGSDLHARLWHGVRELPESTALERVASRHRLRPAWPPLVVARHPGTVTWPSTGDATAARRRRRRVAALAIAFTGVINLASALTLPLAGRLGALRRFAPVEVPELATAVVALAGVGLLFLARGVRRGQRHAWTLAIALLLISVGGHVVKGLDVEEAVAALLVAGFLLLHRDDYTAPGNPSSARRAIVVALSCLVIAIVASTVGIALRHPALPLTKIVEGVSERLIGVTSVAFPHRINMLLSPALLAVGVGVALWIGWLLFRPAVAASITSYRPMSRDRARYLVERYGTDSLSYFALRNDKEWFGFRDTFVAYRVHNGVALVSPDPIGPVGQRAEAWCAFREFADEHGWPVAVMGASADWLPVYRASGMHDLYIGDEAVVDVQRFTLEGKANKSLRQSTGRVRKAGYRVEFFDPSKLEPALGSQLRDLMTESRRGDVERGFSMTLGRVFDADDQGLLLAVAFDADDHPAAFCHYVPARSIHGWSLDLMRRSERPDRPNGLTEFVVVETIEHLRRRGDVGLALNFATFRAVLASETGDRLVHRVEKWFLERMSDSMQIESLWSFNEKFQPEWSPRYACYDSPEHMLVASIAVARAESFWELPFIGRFFAPRGDGGGRGRPAPLPVPGPGATGQGCDGVDATTTEVPNATSST